MKRSIYPHKSLIAFLLILAAQCLFISTAAGERFYLDITAQNVRKVVVAVPDFVNKAGTASSDMQGREMADLLSRGLKFHGFIEILDNSRYDGRSDADWKALGADYVVLAKYESAASGMLVEGRLLDVGEDRMIAGRRYRGSVGQRDDMVLRFCDALIEEFTGVPGISRSRIAFVSDRTGRKELYLTDVMQRDIRQITRHKHLVVSPRFSPDGKYLAYSSYHSGNQNLYMTDLRQNEVTRAISRRKGMNLAPAWAPDGKTMVVTLSKDGSPDLYLMDLKGVIIQRLTSMAGINVSPSWSSDGKTLAFVSDRSGTPQIYLMDMKTYGVSRLTFEGRENTEPNWSPDGKFLVYTSLREGKYQIFTMDPKNPSSAQQVSSGWGEFESPTWSPDGRQIAFSRRRNGRQQICAVMKDGRELRVLFDRELGNQSYPRWTGAMD